MRTYFDSSAFTKRYVEESGSQIVETACMEASELALSILCSPEIISALNRRLREKALSKTQYQAAKEYLLEDIRDADIIDLTTEVVRQSIPLLEAHPLRAIDALHVASALVWKAERFISSDERQLAVAKKAGLKVQAV